MSQVLRVFDPQTTTLDAAVQSFLGICKAKNLSPKTIDYYSFRLAAFRRFLDSKELNLTPEQVTPQVIRDFLTHERESNSATTAQHSLCALRAFFNQLVRDGFLEENPAMKVDKPKRRKTIIQTLSAQQIEDLLATCKRDFYGVRDRTIILTLIDTGIRVSELCGLQVDDVSFEQQVMRVIGKGDKEREVPFGMEVRSALLTYFARRGELESEAVFVNHFGASITPRSIQHMLAARGKEAGITGVRLSPHTIRHTFAKSWLLNGGDAFSLQRCLGHTTMEMVKEYVNLAGSEVQDVHRRVSPADRLQTAKRTNGRKKLR